MFVKYCIKAVAVLMQHDLATTLDYTVITETFKSSYVLLVIQFISISTYLWYKAPIHNEIHLKAFKNTKLLLCR